MQAYVCAPSSFLAGSAKSASALRQDATKGVGSRRGISHACCTHFWGEGRRKKARALDGRGCCKSACLGRTFRGRRPPGFRASARSRMPKPGLLARAAGLAAQARPPLVGNLHNNLLFPNLCASRGLTPPRLPSACACVYSSPSRRTPVDAAARTPRTGYCGRRRRSDRPFRTGFIRWLGEEEILSQAPVFHEFLESIYLNFKVLFGRRVRSWLRTNAGGAPNTCKSRG